MNRADIEQAYRHLREAECELQRNRPEAEFVSNIICARRLIGKALREEEAPPCVGEKFRDAVQDIHRNQQEH